MKKKMIALLAGALMTLSASSAFAYFGGVTGNQFDLVRVVYDTTGSVEVATDLGNVTTVSGRSSAASAFSLSQFGTSKTFGNLNAGYFAYDNATRTVWASSTAVPVNILTGGINSFLTSAQSASSYFNSLGGSTGTVIGDKTATLSYYNQMDVRNGVAIGSMSNLLAPATGELSLAALSTTGYADITLYSYHQNGSRGDITPNGTMVLRTYADGTTAINPTATPIPPAFFLMGSGLLGMVGLRRKQRG